MSLCGAPPPSSRRSRNIEGFGDGPAVLDGVVRVRLTDSALCRVDAELSGLYHGGCGDDDHFSGKSPSNVSVAVETTSTNLNVSPGTDGMPTILNGINFEVLCKP